MKMKLVKVFKIGVVIARKSGLLPRCVLLGGVDISCGIIIIVQMMFPRDWRLLSRI
jgi:hypothetical protein